MFFFGKKKKTSLGIDIGTAAIKVVEIERGSERAKLLTYGEIRAERANQETPGSSISITMADEDIAEMIKTVLKATKASGKNVTLSIPIFSAFITLIKLPQLSPQELSQAIPFEARQYVPVPIQEVTLDWSVVGTKKLPGGNLQTEVLLVAVPNEVINRMMQIAKIAKFDLKAIEVEAFGLARSLVGIDTTPTCIVDLGAKSSDIIIVDQTHVRAAHNFDTAGFNLSQSIVKAMGVSFERAESFKKERGLILGEGEKEILKSLTSLLDLVILEVQRVIAAYDQTSQRKINRLILSGGTANLPGVVDYFQQFFTFEVSVADPFKKLITPPKLKPVLKEIGPAFAVAVGLAMRGF